MKKKAFDLSARASQLMDHADQSASSRWENAEKIVAELPSGLSIAPGARLTVGPAVVPVSDSRPAPAPGTILVEISKVRDNPRNARKVYIPEVVTERAASIRQDGQMTPAPACVDWDNPGSYILIGGHYRKKALLQNGSTHIELKLLPAKNHMDLYRLSYAENEQRQSGTPLDDAMAWRELIDSGDVTSQDEIAALVLKPRTTINKTLALLSLNESVLEVLKDAPGKFTLTAGYELSVMATTFNEVELVGIAQRIAAGEISTRDLTAMKEQRKNAPHRKQKEFSRQHKIVARGQLQGTIKDWDSGKVVLEVVIKDPAERERLVNELRIRFEGPSDSVVGAGSSKVGTPDLTSNS